MSIVTFYLEDGFGGLSKEHGVGAVRDVRNWEPDFWTKIKSIKVSEDAVLRAFSETDFRHEEMTCLPGDWYARN